MERRLREAAHRDGRRSTRGVFMRRPWPAVLLLVFGSVLLVAAPAAAATCTVPSASYPTIQSAVNDTSCDVVDVAAGVYAENVTIGRKLVLNGAGMGVTTIDPPANGPAI